MNEPTTSKNPNPNRKENNIHPEGETSTLPPINQKKINKEPNNPTTTAMTEKFRPSIKPQNFNTEVSNIPCRNNKWMTGTKRDGPNRYAILLAVFGLKILFVISPGIFLMKNTHVLFMLPITVLWFFGTLNFFLAAYKDPGFMKRGNLSFEEFKVNDEEDKYGNNFNDNLDKEFFMPAEEMNDKEKKKFEMEQQIRERNQHCGIYR